MNEPQSSLLIGDQSKEALSAQLFQARADLEDFTYSVSHDMKGPLHTIKGFLEIVLDDLQAGRQASLREDLLRINDAADSLQAQLDSILLFSRMGRRSFHSGAVPLDAFFLRLSERWLEAYLRVGATLVFDSSVVSIYTDEDCLFELMGYLLDNALLFRNSNTALNVKVKFSAEPKAVACTVSDNGVGVQPDLLPRIFDLFRKLDPRSQGRGCGLAYARRLITLQGGNISAQSLGAGQGLSVHFSLPLPRE